MTCTRDRFLLATATLAVMLMVGCASAEDNPFLVGEFQVTRAVDGDTIAVDGLDSTIRFKCIDTEECEKGPGAAERSQALEEGFAVYARDLVREDPLGQFNTPMGWKAKEFAEKWFPIGSKVRIEYDRLTQKSCYYSRVLGYAFVQRDGKWVNYGVECVRAGMSPYSDKYGKSERFEPEFIEAEREARIHRRGIWSKYAMSYPNYDERMAQWWRRGETLARFEQEHRGQQNAFFLLDEADWQRAAKFTGQEVLILCGVKRSKGETEGHPNLELHHKQFDRVVLRFATPELYDAVEEYSRVHSEDFICFRGILASLKDEEDQPYAYSLTISKLDDVYLDAPGLAPGEEHPRGEVEVTGDRISWKDAPKHVGEDVAVVGRIIRTKNIGSVVFLNFHDDYRTTLTAVIAEEHLADFPAPPEVTYMNRTILLRGKVSEHRGSPQIIVTSPDQIEIIE